MSLHCICIAAHYAPALSDEDQEIDPDRWCSHSAWGQEAWQIVAQWTWNVRLELGHQLLTSPNYTQALIVVLPISRLLPMSSAEKPMAACVWCMEPVCAVAAPVHYARHANGMAGQLQSRAR